MATITQLQYILAVNKHKHFGNAAKECHVSQPSLSAQIMKLEDELGYMIFDRSKQPLLLTDIGRKFVEQANEVLKEHKKLFEIGRSNEEPAGNFYLGVIPTLSPYLIPLFLESFSRKYPKVDLKIGEFKTEEIIARLHNDELDGGLLVTPYNDPKIFEKILFYEPFYVFTSPKNALSQRKVVNDADLDSGSVWLLDEGHCFREQVIRICSTKNKNKILSNVKFASGNLETLMNLIRKGDGYTLIPHLTTLGLNEEDRTKYLKSFASPVPTREVSLVYSRSAWKDRILNALETEIIASVPEEIKALKKNKIEVIDI